MQRLPYILVIDDAGQKDSRFHQTLDNLGCEVRYAETGIEGVAVLIERLKLAEPVALVLIELGLKDINGVEAVRRLRSAGYTGPIAVFSVSAPTDVRKLLEGAGANHFFLKAQVSKSLIGAFLGRD